METGAEKNEDIIDLGLNDLTQEDKFFLIQQIEDLNKNIRYCQNSSPCNIYQEDENGDEIDQEYANYSSKKRKSGSKLKYTRNMRNCARGTSRGLDIILDEEEDADLDADGDV